ncbi:unnamed protein product, partial [Musa textilis]
FYFCLIPFPHALINAMYEDMMQQLKVSSVKQLAQQQADGIISQREAGYVDHVKST